VILLDDYRSLAACSKGRSVVKKRATSPHRNRVWNFLETPSGRMSSDASQTVEVATGSITFTYRIVSGRADRLSRDPLGESDGPNVYSHVGNNPSNLVDPNGLWGVQFGDINIWVGDPNAIFTNDTWAILVGVLLRRQTVFRPPLRWVDYLVCLTPTSFPTIMTPATGTQVSAMG